MYEKCTHAYTHEGTETVCVCGCADLSLDRAVMKCPLLDTFVRSSDGHIHAM